MNDATNDRQRVLEWAFRWGVPAFAWAFMFAFFAFADSVSTHAPRELAQAAPAAASVAGDCLDAAPR
jgi:hypothetical protein